MAVFGSPLLFLWAVGFSIIPDVVTILIWKGNDQVAKVPGLSLIHSLHREVHWFETEHPDGTVTYLFPNRPMLALEALLVTLPASRSVCTAQALTCFAIIPLQCRLNNLRSSLSHSLSRHKKFIYKSFHL